MSQTKKITGITDLRDDLLAVYSKARAGKADLSEVNAVSSVAAKIINTARVQLKYHAHLNSKRIIPFLEK